jgi:hypothetical protein
MNTSTRNEARDAALARGRIAKSRLRLNALSAAKAIARLIDPQNPATLADLIEATGLSLVTLRRYVHALHAEGVAYIAAWEHDSTGRPTIPAYALGGKRDAQRPKKPKSLTNKEQHERRKLAKMLGLQRAAANDGRSEVAA